MDMRAFITLQGLIMAALLAWTQQWGHTYDVYKAQGDPIWPVTLALAVIYAAVLVALLSAVLGLFSQGGDVRKRRCFWRLAATLAGSSWSITALLVLLSLGTTFLKALQGSSQWHPTPWLLFLGPFWSTIVATIVSVLILVIWWLRLWDKLPDI